MAVQKLSLELNEKKIEFVIDDIQYTDKVDMRILCLPEMQEEVKKLFANITSGTAEILGCEVLLEKI